jgi:hypothetical protein
MTSGECDGSGRRERIACGLLLLLALGIAPFARADEPTTNPTTQPTTQETDPRSPTGVMHAYLGTLDSGDRQKALAFYVSSDDRETQLTAVKVDMMLAISNLKKTVAAKWGAGAPLDLQMAVVGENEGASVTERIDGNVAHVEVKAVDDVQTTHTYAMVRSHGEWKLTVAEDLKAEELIKNWPFEMKGAKSMISAVQRAAPAVKSGQIGSARDDVGQWISDHLFDEAMKP